jgi:hypothetical protein
MGTRNNIKNQSRKLQDMIGRQQTNIPEMYWLLSCITISTDAMFDCLDKAFINDDDDKKRK